MYLFICLCIYFHIYIYIHIYIYTATHSLLGLFVLLLPIIAVGVQLRGSPLGGYRGPNGGGRWVFDAAISGAPPCKGWTETIIYGGVHSHGGSQNGWFRTENPIHRCPFPIG